MLTSDEFESLSYYHVSRFIGDILMLSSEDAQPQVGAGQVSLRQFICNALDLKYKRTQESQDLIARAHFNMQVGPVRQLWSTESDMQRLDLNEASFVGESKPLAARPAPK